MKKNQVLSIFTSLLLTVVMITPSFVVHAIETDIDSVGNNEISSGLNMDDIFSDLSEEDSVEDEQPQYSGLDWLENALETKDFAVDVSAFTLVEMPNNIDTINNRYSGLMENMIDAGYGERSELEIKNTTGYSVDAMSLFNDNYGDLFPDGITLKKASIPSGFDFASLAGKLASTRDNAYSKIINSEAFTSIKNEISTSKLTDFEFIEDATPKTHDVLKAELGISGFDAAKEIDGFVALQKKYTPKRYQKKLDEEFEKALDNAYSSIYQGSLDKVTGGDGGEKVY